jgi:hypothetical protein
VRLKGEPGWSNPRPVVFGFLTLWDSEPPREGGPPFAPSGANGG